MVAEFNLIIASLIVILSIGVVASHWHERMTWHMIVLGVSLIVLGIINLMTAAPTPLGLQAHIEHFRFVTAFLRGIALVLLVAYAWYRMEQRYRQR